MRKYESEQAVRTRVLLGVAKSAFQLGLALIAVGLGSCSAPSAATDAPPNRSLTTPVVSGVPASGHEEAVFLNGEVWCSGSVIAPRVVLTAGHCIMGSSYYEITAPFAHGQHARSVQLLTYDYNSRSNWVDESRHDVGLIILDRPIVLSRYPVIARSGSEDNTKIISLGRMNEARVDGQMFASAEHSIRVKSDKYYDAQQFVQAGDSGGAVEVAGSNPPHIIAVNSGAGGGRELLARIDGLHDWIQRVVSDNGGYATSADGASSDSNAPKPGLEIRGIGKACVDSNEARSDNGTPVQLWECWGGANQSWVLTNKGQIRGIGGKCLDVQSGSTANGTPVRLWDCNGSAAQTWQLTKSGEIKGPGDKCLDAFGATSANGTRLVLWDCGGGANQKWSVAQR